MNKDELEKRRDEFIRLWMSKFMDRGDFEICYGHVNDAMNDTFNAAVELLQQELDAKLDQAAIMIREKKTIINSLQSQVELLEGALKYFSIKNDCIDLAPISIYAAQVLGRLAEMRGEKK